MTVDEIQWEITNRCNLRCKHCLALSGKPRSNELTTEEAMVALAKFHSAGATKIYFTGGEPFSRPDFLVLLQKATSLGLCTSVITNATMFNEKTLRVIKNLGVKLGVSLDGTDALTNDTIRGQGTFGKIIKTLQRCQDIGIPAQLYVVVVRDNIGQLKALGRLAKDYGCTGIHFNEVTLAGRSLKFVHELALSTEEHSRLPSIIASVAVEVFGERLSQPNDQCWADGLTFYMASDGNLYLCSEISQRRLDLAIGNIRSFSFQGRLANSAQLSAHQKCCYSMQASERVTFLANISPICVLAPDKPARIETLEQLYQEFDRFYQNIEQYCNECKDSDCIGYVWLLPQEAKELYEQGIEVLEINNSVNFLNPFAGRNREINIEQFQPPCPWRKKKKCTIYSKRPLVCRMYPLAFATEDDIVYLVLHLDCLYSRQKVTDVLFRNQVITLFTRLHPRLLKEITETYQRVDSISKFPEGANKYLRLVAVSQLHTDRKERR